MTIVFIFFYITLGQNFALNGTYPTCLPPSWYANLGVVPGDRSEIRAPINLKSGWDSAIIGGDIMGILLREAMGFTTMTWYHENGAAPTYAAIKEGKLDLAVEIWQEPMPEDSRYILSLGTVGYEGFEALFISDDILNSSVFSPEITKSFRCGDTNCLQEYIFHQDKEVFEYIAQHNPMKYIFQNDFGLADLLNETCDVPRDTAHLPDRIYLSENCAPIDRNGSSMTFPPGFENIPIDLYTGETIFLNTSTHILPNCSIWNDMYSTWHINLFQSLQKNLDIPAAMYWWGSCRLTKLVTILIGNQIPIMFYGWQPDYMTAVVDARYSVMQFGPLEDGCYAWDTTNAYGDGPNTCGFPASDTLKIAGGNYFLKPQADDVLEVITKFAIPLKDSNEMTVDANTRREQYTTAEINSGKLHFDIACEWIQTKNETWLSWLPEKQYQPFVPIIIQAEEDGMSDLEIVITAICGIAVFGIITFYIFSHSNSLEFLKKVGTDVLDMAAGIMFMVTFTVFDLITDILNFVLVINKNSKVTPLFQTLYLICLCTSSLVCIFLLRHAAHMCCEVFGSHKSLEIEQRRALSVRRHDEYKLNMKRDTMIAESGVLIFEDVPFLLLNLYFTFYFAEGVKFFNLLAIVTGCLFIGINFNSLVNQRAYEQMENELRQQMQRDMLYDGAMETTRDLQRNCLAGGDHLTDLGDIASMTWENTITDVTLADNPSASRNQTPRAFHPSCPDDKARMATQIALLPEIEDEESDVIGIIHTDGDNGFGGATDPEVTEDLSEAEETEPCRPILCALM